MKRLTKLMSVLAAGALFMGALAGCGGSKDAGKAGDTIKVGGLLEMTGGSTIAGVRVLEERGFRGAAMDCVCAAYAKNKELGK